MINNNAIKVILVGYRNGAARTLRKHNIPYAIWAPTLTEKQKQQAIFTVTKAFPTDATAIKTIAQEFLPYGQFTHVIACTEQSVYPASLARRVLGARKSVTSVILSCHDKLIMKNKLKSQGIPMTAFMECNQHDNVDEVIAQLGLPVVVKERKQSGGRGTEFCHDKAAVARALKKNRILEKFVNAPEASVESFIDQGQIRFTNITQYHTIKHINIVPAVFDEATKAAILALNEQVIKALKLSWGMTHLEVYLTEQGPLFGEIAIRPPGGYIMDLLEKSYEFDPWEAYLAVQLGQDFPFQQQAAHYSAVVILHPGVGTVKSINGIDQLRQHQAIQAVNLKVDIGDIIEPRHGVGNDIGRVLIVTDNSDEIHDAIAFINKHLKIEITPT